MSLTVTGTSKTLTTELQPGTQYKWDLVPVSASGQEGYGAENDRYFTTQEAPDDAGYLPVTLDWPVGDDRPRNQINPKFEVIKNGLVVKTASGENPAHIGPLDPGAYTVRAYHRGTDFGSGDLELWNEVPANVIAYSSANTVGIRREMPRATNVRLTYSNYDTEVQLGGLVKPLSLIDFTVTVRNSSSMSKTVKVRLHIDDPLGSGLLGGMDESISKTIPANQTAEYLFSNVIIPSEGSWGLETFYQASSGGYNKSDSWPYKLIGQGGEFIDRIDFLASPYNFSDPGPAFIRTADGSAIDPEKNTWLLIHGLADNSDSWFGNNKLLDFHAMLKMQRPDDQILVLDWRDGSGNTRDGVSNWVEAALNWVDDKLFRAESFIKPTGVKAAEALWSAGFRGANLNIIGHSFGANMGDELAEKMKHLGGGGENAKVNTMVALDPARNAYSSYFPKTDINFKDHFRYSWAFHSSWFGSEDSPSTAHEAFLMPSPFWKENVPSITSIPLHTLPRNIFARLQYDNDGISNYFKLSRLLQRSSGPWALNRFDYAARKAHDFGFSSDNKAYYEAILWMDIHYDLIAMEYYSGEELKYISPLNQPVIKVYGNGYVPEGTDSSSSEFGTLFAETSVGATSPILRFEIENKGSTLWNHGEITVQEEGNGRHFEVVGGSPGNIVPNVPKSFTIKLTTQDAGVFNGIVTIPSDHGEIADYTFAISGTVGSSDGPNVVVLGNGRTIADGDVTPTSLDHTQFQTVSVGTSGSSVRRTFTVRNTGSVASTLSNWTVSGDFQFVGTPPSSISAGGSDTFTVEMDTSSDGVKSGDVQFATQDSSAAIYNFRVWGEVLAPQTAVRALTVDHIGPASEVYIHITGDRFGAGDGDTPFARSYSDGSLVTIVAPESVGNFRFVHWKLDGVDFTSTLQTGFLMSADRTIIAVYEDTGGVVETVATPSISPAGGDFTSSVAVTISSPTSGAEVRYTTNGSAPISSSTLYTGPVTLTSNSTIRASAFKSGWNPSGTASETFTRTTATTGAVLQLSTNESDVSSWTGTLGISVRNAGSGDLTWTATTTAPWLHITTPSGEGGGRLSITRERNTDIHDRVGTIVVTAPGAQASPQVLTVRQNRIEHTVKLETTPSASGTVKGVGWSLPTQWHIPHGDETTVEATPNLGFVFEAWLEDDTVVSNDAVYTFTVTGTRILTARFRSVEGTIQLAGRVIGSSQTGMEGLSITGLPTAIITDSQGEFTGTVPYGFLGVVSPQSSTHDFVPGGYAIGPVNGEVDFLEFLGKPAPVIDGAFVMNHATAASDSQHDEYPDVATDGNGNWIAVWQSKHNVNGSIGSDRDILFARSSDNGDTWTAAALLNPDGASDSENDYDPKIATDGNGTWVVAWRSYNSGDDADIFFSRSTNNGQSWSNSQPVYSSAWSDDWSDGDPEIFVNNGHWTVTWEHGPRSSADGDDEVYFAQSTNGAQSWTNPGALNTDAGTDGTKSDSTAHLVYGIGDTVHAFWPRRPSGGDSRIVMASSSNAGATWSSPRQITQDGSGSEHHRLAVAIDETGQKIWVVFSRDKEYGFPWKSYMTHSVDGGATWTTMVPTQPDFASADSGDGDPSLFYLGDGKLALVWMRKANGSSLWETVVSRSFDEGSSWTGARSVRVAGSPIAGGDNAPRVDIGMDNRIIVVWQSQDDLGLGLDSDMDILASRIDLPVVDDPPEFVSLSVVKGQIGEAVEVMLEVIGSPTSFSAVGLPAGLSIDSATGAITGVPLDAGETTATVTAVNAAGGTEADLHFSIAKGVPVVEWVSPSPLVYGDALGAEQLNANSTVAGSFSYNPSAGTLLDAGSGQVLNVSFTPSDPTRYESATAMVTINVLKANPSLAWDDAEPIRYGTALDGIQLDAESEIPGDIEYNPPAGTVLSAGLGQTLTSTFTPTDSANWNSITVEASIDVLKALPVIEWSDPAAIVYGMSLSNTQLNASCGIEGSFAYLPPAGTVLAAGSGRQLEAVFTPTDTANYETVTAQVMIDVEKALPVVSWQQPGAIIHGVPLSEAQLSAVSNVPGNFVYDPPIGAIPDAGLQQTLQVTFRPQDTDNYKEVVATTSIDVSQAKPAIIWSDPAPVIYGTTLSDEQLNATASVPGSFTYDPPAGTLLEPSPGQTLRVDFVPDDALNYESVSRTVSLEVQRVTPVLTWPIPAPISYGTALDATQLNASSDVPGTLSYNPAAGTVLPAGSGWPLEVVFTPDDPVHYKTVTASVNIDVSKAEPVLTWPTPDPMVYGNPLGSEQLAASCSIDGDFTYTPLHGTILQTGEGQLLSVTFTPTDSANYETSSAQVTINVLKAMPTILWDAPGLIIHGTPLGADQLNAVANVPGTFTYTPALGTVLEVGDGQLLTAEFTPDDTANYVSVSANVSIDVKWPAPQVEGPLDVVMTRDELFSSAISATNQPSAYEALDLPPGLAVDTATGLISGTPTALGTYLVTLEAGNETGTGRRETVFTVLPPPPVISLPVMASVKIGDQVEWQVEASENPSGYSATDLPAGLSIDAVSGVLFGIVDEVGTFPITLSATNDGGTGSAIFTLEISHAPPRGSKVGPNSIAENQPVDTVVGHFATSDPDHVDSFTYQLVEGEGDDDNGLFQIAGDTLIAKVSFDYEEQIWRTVRVRTTDSYGLTWEGVVEILVLNLVGEGSGGVGISDATVMENQPAGTLVGVLVAVDPDPGDTFTYTLVEGVGSEDNGKFQIVGDRFETADSLDFEEQELYSVRVRITDSGSNILEEVILVSLLDDDSEDFDGDGLTQADEAVEGTSDLDWDSDDDGAGDGVEVARGTSPQDGSTYPPGTVLAWGRADKGALNLPVDLHGVVDVDGGFNRAVALKADGTAVEWGDNALEVPVGLSGIVAVASGNGFATALLDDGTVTGWGGAPVGLTDVVEIAAGENFGLALQSDGTVTGWGGGPAGEIPAGLSDVIGIAAGRVHALAVKADGTVVAWGTLPFWADYEQTTVPADLTGVVAVAARERTSLALKSDGTVVEWGEPTGIPADLSDVVDLVSRGQGHVLARLGDGSLVGWGFDSHGQTSVPGNLGTTFDVATGNAFSLAVRSKEPVPKLTKGQKAAGQVGVFFGFTPNEVNSAATGFAALGLPEGLVMDSVTGEISGVPSTVGRYSVRIIAKNDQGWDSSIIFLQITEGQPPTDIALSSGEVSENLPAGSPVGILSATDPDPDE
ncbi:MAG: putative Ig domain-containing protein, partial [Nitrospirales bacterium]